MPLPHKAQDAEASVSSPYGTFSCSGVCCCHSDFIRLCYTLICLPAFSLRHCFPKSHSSNGLLPQLLWVFPIARAACCSSLLPEILAVWSMCIWELSSWLKWERQGRGCRFLSISCVVWLEMVKNAGGAGRGKMTLAFLSWVEASFFPPEPVSWRESDVHKNSFLNLWDTENVRHYHPAVPRPALTRKSLVKQSHQVSPLSASSCRRQQ